MAEEEKLRKEKLLSEFRNVKRNISCFESLKRLFVVLSVAFFINYLLYWTASSLIGHYVALTTKYEAPHNVEPLCPQQQQQLYLPHQEELTGGSMLYPIKPSAVPGLRCKPIISRTNVNEIRASLAHHLMESDFDHICAQHIDVQTCVCMMRMPSDDNNGSAAAAAAAAVVRLPHMIDVINLHLSGFSSRSIVVNRESSLFCKGMPIVNVRRYERVYASMETLDSGEPFERWYSGQVAYSLQQIFEIQIGLPPCRDNLDELSRWIKERNDDALL